MGCYSTIEWLELNAPPELSYSECMDRLFEMWCNVNDDSTFEEFCARPPREDR
jgi:hypothetical protein